MRENTDKNNKDTFHAVWKQENQNQPLEDVLQNSSSATVLKQFKRSVQEFIQSTNIFQIHLGNVSKTVFVQVFFYFY